MTIKRGTSFVSTKLRPPGKDTIGKQIVKGYSPLRLCARHKNFYLLHLFGTTIIFFKTNKDFSFLNSYHSIFFSWYSWKSDRKFLSKYLRHFAQTNSVSDKASSSANSLSISLIKSKSDWVIIIRTSMLYFLTCKISAYWKRMETFSFHLKQAFCFINLFLIFWYNCPC